MRKALPSVLGIYFDHLTIGFPASFGAYLVAATHTTVPSKGRERQLTATVLMLSTGATVGAAAGHERMDVYSPGRNGGLLASLDGGCQYESSVTSGYGRSGGASVARNGSLAPPLAQVPIFAK
jgi:hypothetical protein